MVTKLSSLRYALVLLVGLLAASSARASDGLYGLSFEALSGEANVALADYKGKPFAMLVFEDECKWCLKQMRTFNTLVEQGKVKDVVAVGKGDKHSLKRWARRASPTYPLAQINRELLQALDGVKTTPITLLVDANGQVSQVVRGYLPEQEMAERLAKIN
ncbi:conjugal transfer protein TraF [Corallincola platygyrae]